MDEKTINTLCEKFHTTVENLIPKYAEYAMMKDMISIIICVVLMVICAGILYFIYKKYKGCDILDFPFGATIVSITCAVVLVLVAIALGCNIYDYVLWHNCPDLRFLDVVGHLG